LAYEREVRITVTKLLTDCGSQFGRLYADAFKGSKHSNMKELRLEAADGEWRAAFAVGPHRPAILLVAGDKSRGSRKVFSRLMVAKPGFRFSGHRES